MSRVSPKNTRVGDNDYDALHGAARNRDRERFCAGLRGKPVVRCRCAGIKAEVLCTLGIVFENHKVIEVNIRGTICPNLNTDVVSSSPDLKN
jgi:hypothetical protein